MQTELQLTTEFRPWVNEISIYIERERERAIMGRYRKVKPKPKPNWECRMFNLHRESPTKHVCKTHLVIISYIMDIFVNFYFWIFCISCIILHMVKMFHIKIRKISFWQLEYGCHPLREDDVWYCSYIRCLMQQALAS